MVAGAWQAPTALSTAGRREPTAGPLWRMDGGHHRRSRSPGHRSRVGRHAVSGGRADVAAGVFRSFVSERAEQILRDARLAEHEIARVLEVVAQLVEVESAQLALPLDDLAGDDDRLDVAALH